MKSPKFDHIIQNVYLYEHPDRIISVDMDMKSQLLVNHRYVMYQGKPLTGYSLLASDYNNKKLLLRKDINE